MPVFIKKEIMKQISIFLFAMGLMPIFLHVASFQDLLTYKSDRKRQEESQHALTFKLETWRRLGDNLTVYAKAKCFQENFNLPLYCKHFSYYDQFQFSRKENLLTPDVEKQFSKIITVNRISDLADNLSCAEPILFEVHFLTETPWLYNYSREHPVYEKKLKELIRPLEVIGPLPKPEGVITVAVHVRKGGGFDMPLASAQEYQLDDKPIKGFYLIKNSLAGSYTDIWPLNWPAGPKFFEALAAYLVKKNRFSDYIWPIKFPPDQYYIDQIKKLAELLPGKNLLIYIFTDDPKPELIVQRYSKALESFPRIIFSYRQAGNHHTKNVLHDLFSLTQCDCLISASSSFGFIAQLLGDHSIIMFPIRAIALPDKIIINKVGIVTVVNALDRNKRKISYGETQIKIK